MQRQRDGLIPIGDALSGMGGPMKSIREASPQALRHFTRFDQVNQLVSASEADASLAQMGQRTVAQLVKGPLHSRCFTEQRPRPLVGQPPLASLALYFVYYNFCRIHKTLRVTPAMEAGLADMPRDAEWIVELVDATGPKPGSKQGTQ